MYSSKDFTSQELAGMPSKPHPITCLASAGILVYKYELVKGLSEKTTRESAELEGLFQLWKAYVRQETRRRKRAWYDELSKNARMENKLIEFLRSRSIFVARMDRASYKMGSWLNDKIMMCGLFNTWANYVIEQKEHAYGQLPMPVFLHVRLDWLTCWMSWGYYMMDKKYNKNLIDDCYD